MDACSYHTSVHAPWHCTGCGRSYCVECMPGGRANFGRAGARCPLCRTRLSWRGYSQVAPPFWRISKSFFVYGLRPPALGVMALVFVLAVLFFLLVDKAVGTGVAIVALGLIPVLCSGYVMTVIARMAQGDWRVPGITDTYSADAPAAVPLLVLLVLLGVMPWMSCLIEVSSLASFLLAQIPAVVAPACIMVLAATGSLWQALDPVLVVRVIAVIGWSYVPLWLTLSAILSNGPLLAGDLLSGPAAIVVFPLWLASSFYFVLVASAMVGYVLYQRSVELGLPTAIAEGRDLPAADYACLSARAEANIFLQEKRPEDALSLLTPVLEKYPDDFGLHERMHQLLLRYGLDDPLARHTDMYCALLVRKHNAGKAAFVWREVRARLPDYLPGGPEACDAIARYLYERGQGGEARPLLDGFADRFPTFPGLPSALLLHARICLEDCRDAAAARAAIAQIRSRFPESESAREADRYAPVIDRLG